MLVYCICRARETCEWIQVSELRRESVAVCGADGVGVQRIGIVDEQLLAVGKPVIVGIGMARIGVVREQLVDGENTVVVRVLIICIILGKRVKRHGGDVRRQGVGSPCISAEGRTGENA